MCDCIEQIKKQIKELDPEGSLDGIQSFLCKNCKVGEAIIYYRMCGSASMRKKKKDGTFTSRRNKVGIAFNYYPFCGERY